MKERRQTKIGVWKGIRNGCIQALFPESPSGQAARLSALLDFYKFDMNGFVRETAGVFSSYEIEAKLRLLHEIASSLRSGAMDWMDGYSQVLLDEWPAQRLDFVDLDGWDVDAWPSIWAENGGKLFHGEMAALKSDPIWKGISFLGLPFPPFLPESWVRVDDVPREQAASWGLCPKHGGLRRIDPVHIAPDDLARKLAKGLTDTEPFRKDPSNGKP